MAVLVLLIGVSVTGCQKQEKAENDSSAAAEAAPDISEAAPTEKRCSSSSSGRSGKFAADQGNSMGEFLCTEALEGFDSVVIAMGHKSIIHWSRKYRNTLWRTCHW